MARLASAATIEMEDQSMFNAVLGQLTPKKKVIDTRERSFTLGKGSALYSPYGDPIW